jgi:hypothetical protein
MLASPYPLKGHGNEADFQGFLQKLVPHRSLTLYFSSRSDFGFEFAEIFFIEKQLPNSASRRLHDSPSRRDDFWMFKRKLGELGSRYGESGSRYLNFFEFF